MGAGEKSMNSSPSTRRARRSIQTPNPKKNLQQEA
jgi:hypothetical protein